MRLNVAVIERAPVWTVFKEDIYKAVYYWVRQTGFETSLTYNELVLTCPNLIIGSYYLEPDHLRALLGSGIPFGLLETEVVRPEGGHNETIDTERFELHRQLYQSARMIMSGAAPNVAAFAEMGLLCHLLPLGYCHWLDSSRPLPDEHQDIQLLFFGNQDARRAALLEVLKEDFQVTVLPEVGLVTNFFRNGWVSRAKIILSLKRGLPYTHLGASRIWHMAHLQALTISEPPEEDDTTADGLCEFVELGQFKETISHFLRRPDERRAKGEEFYENLRRRDTETVFRSALASLSDV